MADIQGKVFADEAAFFASKKPGDMLFRNDGTDRPVRLIFWCPCGCESVGGVSIKPAAENGWEWNGSKDAPTFTPSIRFIGGCGWHGYLTDGIFRSC